MFCIDRDVVLPLPEEAFEVEAHEVLALWLGGGLQNPPAWLARAVRDLQPIERRALANGSQIGWANESARARLHLAALDQDGQTMSASMQDELAVLDRCLRDAARSERDEAVITQIGHIRIALRPHLTKKVTRRERAAIVGSHRCVR